MKKLSLTMLDFFKNVENILTGTPRNIRIHRYNDESVQTVNISVILLSYQSLQLIRNLGIIGLI